MNVYIATKISSFYVADLRVASARALKDWRLESEFFGQQSTSSRLNQRLPNQVDSYTHGTIQETNE